MMIIRAALTVVLVIGLLAAPLVAEAQQPGRAPVVGVLLLGPPTPTPLTAVFKEALRELGYVEGQSIAFEYRGAEGQDERLPALAAELARHRMPPHDLGHGMRRCGGEQCSCDGKQRRKS